MPESIISFKSLPTEYQQVIQLAEDRHEIAITPLQELAGGWSGAIIYLVRVASVDSGRVEHLILKLDRKRPMSSSDEISRHLAVQQKSPAEFSNNHIPDMVYDRVEADNALAIFYSIAGQSLHNFRTLSSYRRQTRLDTLFAQTNHYLLDVWNAGLEFEQYDHPKDLLERWLGFRLDVGQNIEKFLTDTCRLSPQTPGFISLDNILPNPLLYARKGEMWGAVRSGDAMVGLQHSDLNTNNILAKFSRGKEELAGYYLIDFALFKGNMPLLYDHRYLEMSYLVHSIGQGKFSSVVDLICRYGEHDILAADDTPIEMAGVNSAVSTGRAAFENWVVENHPSLYDDLWGQYWLAGAAAGLSYCHKIGQEDAVRLAGLLYGAANLKRYFKLFGIPLPTEASQLYTEGQFGRQAVMSGTVSVEAKKPLNNLPPPPTNFIGRQIELEEVSALMDRPEVRMLTLTGPGGTGKTRLGLEVGRNMLNRFPDGVYFIDLAQITDPSYVSITAAHTMGIREGGGMHPLETLKEYLAWKELLLIFDNFEQITAAASDIAQLLEAAPGLKALVTSRIALQLRWEHEYPVEPLDMPPDGQRTPAETLEYGSVSLFRQQAKAVRPSFEITEENLTPVIEICRRLDGLPLAIEIAAARIKMLTPQALLNRLDRSLNLLVGGAKDLPDRQRTLRRTIDWSYELLENEEREIFIRLGIFAGGFTLDAAEDICTPLGEVDILSGIETLLNNSLLRLVHSVSNEPRFDMLQTIREFALEKASELEMDFELHWAHNQYFTNLAASVMGEGVFGAESVNWLQRLEEEHDNYRLALAWALEHPAEGVESAMAIMNQLSWFWYRYGYLQEGIKWTERTLQITESMGIPMLRSLALTSRSYFALWSGDLMVAAQLAREAVELSQQLEFDFGLSMAKLGYGTTLINQGKDKEAYPHLVDAVELYDQQNQPWMKGTTLVHLANVSLGLGDPEQAIQWLDMAMPYLRQSGDVWSMAFGLNNYGEVARVQGDYEQAEGYYRRTEDLYKQADAIGDQARLVHTLGYIALHKGDFEKAEELFKESLEDFLELGNHRGIAECLAGLAGLAAEQGNYKWAIPLLSAAESQLQAFGGAWWPADRVEIDHTRECSQSVLQDEFDELWSQGQSMGVDEAIAYAIQGV